MFFDTLFAMDVIVLHFLRFSVLSLTCTNCDLRELNGLWTSVTSCDLNGLCRCFQSALDLWF